MLAPAGRRGRDPRHPALTNAFRSLLFGVEPTDPVTLAAVAVPLAAVTLVATWLPARSAAALDPAAGLRED